MKKKNRRYQFWLHLILILVTLSVVLPFVLLFISSISSERTLLNDGYSYFPKEFSLDAYRYIWNNRKTVIQSYANTILITFVGTFAHVMMASMLAFPLSLKKFPGRKFFSFLVLFTMLFSGGLVPSYIMWTSIFKIKNTLWALLLPNLMLSAMNVMLMRSFFSSSIPDAIFEAARIDGANYMRIYSQIVLPLGKPIIVTVAVFAGLGYWNDWLNSLYYVTKSQFLSTQGLLNKMLVDIQALQSAGIADASTAISRAPQVSVRMAIAVVALLPVLVIYPFLQKYFASGISLGAVKG